MVAAGLVALAVIAQVDAVTPSDGPPPAPLPQNAAGPPKPAQATTAPPTHPETDIPPLPPPSPPPAPPPTLQAPPPRLYGDKGSIELGAGLTYSSEAGFAANASARYYIVDALAPGIEATFVAGGPVSSRYGVLLGSLRVLPVRVRSLAVALTGRAGRVFVGDHSDGWGVGGAASVIFLFSPTVGLELGYEFLRLVPDGFCSDLGGCVIQGPIIAVRFGF